MVYSQVCEIPVDSPVRCAAFSADLRYLGLYTKRGMLQLCTIEGKALWSYGKEDAGVPNIRLSHDADRLLFQSDYGLYCYTRNGDLDWVSFAKVEPHHERFCGIALSGNGRRAFLRTQGELVQYLDGAVIMRIPHTRFGGHFTQSNIYKRGNVAFLEEQGLFGYLSPWGFHLCDISGVAHLAIPVREPEDFALHPDGRYVAITSKESLQSKCLTVYRNGHAASNPFRDNIFQTEMNSNGLFLMTSSGKMQGLSLSCEHRWTHAMEGLWGDYMVSCGGPVVAGNLGKKLHLCSAREGHVTTVTEEKRISFSKVSPNGEFVVYSTPKKVVVLKLDNEQFSDHDPPRYRYSTPPRRQPGEGKKKKKKRKKQKMRRIDTAAIRAKAVALPREEVTDDQMASLWSMFDDGEKGQ